MARTKVFNEEEVLDKALAIFWHKGYNGTSMQDLIDGLEISRSSLYDTYGDKYKLFVAALERYRKKIAGQMIGMISQSASPKATIATLFKELVTESLSDKLQRGCFMVNAAIENAPHDKTIATIIAENMQDVEKALYLTIKKGQDAGEISKKHQAKALSRFLINGVNGVRVSARLGMDKKVYNDVVNVTLSVLD